MDFFAPTLCRRPAFQDIFVAVVSLGCLWFGITTQAGDAAAIGSSPPRCTPLSLQVAADRAVPGNVPALPLALPAGTDVRGTVKDLSIRLVDPTGREIPAVIVERGPAVAELRPQELLPAGRYEVRYILPCDPGAATAIALEVGPSAPLPQVIGAVGTPEPEVLQSENGCPDSVAVERQVPVELTSDMRAWAALTSFSGSVVGSGGFASNERVKARTTCTPDAAGTTKNVEVRMAAVIFGVDARPEPLTATVDIVCPSAVEVAAFCEKHPRRGGRQPGPAPSVPESSAHPTEPPSQGCTVTPASRAPASTLWALAPVALAFARLRRRRGGGHCTKP